MGYYHRVKIQLFEGEYTINTMEPYAGYMGMWEKQKNAADAVIAKSKEQLKVVQEEEEKQRLNDEIKKATINRNQSKLFANSLPGRKTSTSIVHRRWSPQVRMM